jgi:hypothetical protein
MCLLNYARVCRNFARGNQSHTRNNCIEVTREEVTAKNFKQETKKNYGQKLPYLQMQTRCFMSIVSRDSVPLNYVRIGEEGVSLLYFLRDCFSSFLPDNDV